MPLAQGAAEGALAGDEVMQVAMTGKDRPPKDTLLYRPGGRQMST